MFIDTQEVLLTASKKMIGLNSNVVDVVDIPKPHSIGYAKQFTKIISKLSPLIGNMIELSTIDLLNEYDWKDLGKWVRQDPGFPDALFESDSVIPNPGIEVKAWFPLATEITARFKESATLLSKDNINVVLVAWLPEHVIWGRPKIINVLVVTAKSVAEARNSHYHHPPDYLVFEPEDTINRTSNLRQLNTSGYKLQADKCDAKKAQAVVKAWGLEGEKYSSDLEYQQKLRTLYANYVYRFDTNYAKIDRIEHTEIEDFKTKVLGTQFHGKTIKEWGEILSSNNDIALESAIRSIL